MTRRVSSTGSEIACAPAGIGRFESPLWVGSGRRYVSARRPWVGELYAETLHFEDLVDRARKRIGVYKDRLKVELN